VGGALVGLGVGASVGGRVGGALVGLGVGASVGGRVGGALVGLGVGASVGGRVGGALVGLGVGATVTAPEGATVTKAPSVSVNSSVMVTVPRCSAQAAFTVTGPPPASGICICAEDMTTRDVAEHDPPEKVAPALSNM